MDLVRLGERYTNTYIPDILIEGYNSLIWTERQLDFGEFELKSFDVLGLMALLPQDTLVSHLETREVMVVETFEINMVGEGADAQPELTVRGRTATSILDSRWVESSYQKKRVMRKKYSATSAAVVLLVNAVDNASGHDVTRGDDDPDTEGGRNDWDWTTKDPLPNVAVTESVPVEGDTNWWQLEQGSLWPQLQKILLDADLGLRCIRPMNPTPGTVITVDSALATRGTIHWTAKTNISELQFNVYSGVDRTSGSGSVQFSQLQGHIAKPQYLMSTKDYKSALEVMSGAVEIKDVFQAGETNLTGWARKVGGFDAGSPEIPDEPNKPKDLKSNASASEKHAHAQAMDTWIDKHAKWQNKRDKIVGNFRDATARAALRELKARRRVDMFSGDISTLSPYVYKIDYDLGDTVLLHGDYGKSSKMIVSEYVRTDDINGDIGFPGLVAP